MMKSLFLCLFSVPLLLGAAVVQVNDLPAQLAERARPDVCGWVNVDDTALPQVNPQQHRTPPSVCDGWPVTYAGNSFEGGLLVDLDDDGVKEIIVNLSMATCVFHADGTLMDGWPQTLGYAGEGSPAYGDIDGDGVGEIVSNARQAGTGNQGRVYAWEADGTPVAGFPFNPGGGPTRTPCLADIDQDDDLEIIIEVRAYPNGYVSVIQGDGTVVDGWPQTLDYIPGSGAACGDITGDGIPEIIAESYYKVWVYDTAGNPLEGWPYTPAGSRNYSYSSPVLLDMDGDGLREIIVGDHSTDAGNGQVHCLDLDGTLLDGWPQTVTNWIYAPVAVGDIDGDGEPDLAVGDQVMSSTAGCYMRAWHLDGSALTGWPAGPVWSINTQAIIADLDGDGDVELMWDDNTTACEYQGYNSDGTAMADWPLSAGTGGFTMFMTPTVDDVDGAGSLAIIGGSYVVRTSYTSTLYLWSTDSPWDASLAYSPMMMYNARHDGVFAVGETPPPPPPTLYGDVNDDDAVTSADANLTLAYAAGLDPLPNDDPRPWEADRFERADVDNDAAIRALDASLILQKAEGLIDSFPVEQEQWDPPIGAVNATWDDENDKIVLTADGVIYAFDLTVLGPNNVYLLEPTNMSEGHWDTNIDESSTLYAVSYARCHAASSGQVLCRIPTQNLPDEGVTITICIYANQAYQENDVELLHVDVNDPTAATPRAFLGNAPNPFNPSTTVSFSLPAAGQTQLTVYNTRGQRVRTLANTGMAAGGHSVVWDGRDDTGRALGSGVYLLRLSAPDTHLTRKILMLK